MKKFALLVLLVCATASTACYAGVLMEEWTENNKRYCKYSDGEVKKISFGSTCPRTN
ncbi:MULTISPECIES: hypothetical protein [Pseudidiomarina]|uniref:Lipoprotein n=3 Tax=Pseudidiomarina TaxID=2800384 RepID=A0A368UK67_9GAMM|nr:MULTISPECIES: hypothetical protein [Pseudidiomarina]PWW07919.1 hypothetical protein DET45_12425 [Pseudidiomarina maritima]RBP86925.1 hypothetical protein DFO81_12425 [Pseudidiomarina tainanensis]RCW29087.1 hypothetical protein DFO79_12325 [Pseudidiomarina tainanensis]